MQILTRPFSPESKALLEAYLTGSDLEAEQAMRALRRDPDAMDFILAILPKEEDESIRLTIVSGIANYGDWSVNPRTIPTLRAQLEREPSPDMIPYIVETLRKLALRDAGLREGLDALKSRARASGDTAMFRVASGEADDVAYLQSSSMVFIPRFARTPPPVFAAAPSSEPVRVLAFGDFGWAHHLKDPENRGGYSKELSDRHAENQIRIAKAMREYDAHHPFTIGLTTGDNFYPAGIPDPDDPAWEAGWEELYGPMAMKVYASLGNHDWGDPSSPMSEYVYGLKSPSWRMPAIYYSYTVGPAQFFAVNTNEFTAAQLAWLREEMAKSTARWKIVYGHFPVYEQTDYSVEKPQEHLLPILMELGADMYLAGHAHSLQHWQLDGIDYFVTGAGAADTYTFPNVDEVRPGKKYLASEGGFAVLDISESTVAMRFIGRDGDVLYEYVRRK